MRITATLISISKSCFSTRSEFTISHLVRRACAWSLENASPQADRQAGSERDIGLGRIPEKHLATSERAARYSGCGS